VPAVAGIPVRTVELVSGTAEDVRMRARLLSLVGLVIVGLALLAVAVASHAVRAGRKWSRPGPTRRDFRL
jgi:hypothetical protein